MRLDKPRLLDPDSAITRQIARAFPDPNLPFSETCADEWIGRFCTRQRQHDGPHVSHDPDGNPVAVWPKARKR